MCCPCTASLQRASCTQKHCRCSIAAEHEACALWRCSRSPVLRGDRVMGTCRPSRAPRRKKPHVRYEREVLRMPDGGCVALDTEDPPTGKASRSTCTAVLVFSAESALRCEVYPAARSRPAARPSRAAWLHALPQARALLPSMQRQRLPACPFARMLAAGRLQHAQSARKQHSLQACSLLAGLLSPSRACWPQPTHLGCPPLVPAAAAGGRARAHPAARADGRLGGLVCATRRGELCLLCHAVPCCAMLCCALLFLSFRSNPAARHAPCLRRSRGLQRILCGMPATTLAACTPSTPLHLPHHTTPSQLPPSFLPHIPPYPPVPAGACPGGGHPRGGVQQSRHQRQPRADCPVLLGVLHRGYEVRCPGGVCVYGGVVWCGGGWWGVGWGEWERGPIGRSKAEWQRLGTLAGGRCYVRAVRTGAARAAALCCRSVALQSGRAREASGLPGTPGRLAAWEPRRGPSESGALALTIAACRLRRLQERSGARAQPLPPQPAVCGGLEPGSQHHDALPGWVGRAAALLPPGRVGQDRARQNRARRDSPSRGCIGADAGGFLVESWLQSWLCVPAWCRQPRPRLAACRATRRCRLPLPLPVLQGRRGRRRPSARRWPCATLSTWWGRALGLAHLPGWGTRLWRICWHCFGPIVGHSPSAPVANHMAAGCCSACLAGGQATSWHSVRTAGPGTQPGCSTLCRNCLGGGGLRADCTVFPPGAASVRPVQPLSDANFHKGFNKIYDWNLARRCGRVPQARRLLSAPAAFKHAGGRKVRAVRSATPATQGAAPLSTQHALLSPCHAHPSLSPRAA